MATAVAGAGSSAGDEGGEAPRPAPTPAYAAADPAIKEKHPPCWRCKGAGIVQKHKQHTPRECNVCGGTGVLKRTRAMKRHLEPKPSTWERPGPPARGGVTPEADESLCRLTGSWCILQGATHRYSTDDVVTAWVAKQEVGSTPPVSVLDMGCGIGSVLLMDAWLFQDAVCVGVEAQEARASRARRSIKYNGADDRVSVRVGDLRDPALFADGRTFDLITGTPPYFPAEQGGLPACTESAACLFEMRGGVEAYAEAAARWLAPDGVFVVCDTSLGKPRVVKGAADAGLCITFCLDVIPKTGRLPLFSVFVMKRGGAPPASAPADGASGVPPSPAAAGAGGDGTRSKPIAQLTPMPDGCKVDTITVRLASNDHSPEYYQLLVDMGKAEPKPALKT